jgi:hypothetical protein
MTTKSELISELKLTYPTLRTGSDEGGYTELSSAEYTATIGKWADDAISEAAKVAAAQAEAEANATAKAALLSRLGITADEAKLLLS